MLISQSKNVSRFKNTINQAETCEMKETHVPFT